MCLLCSFYQIEVQKISYWSSRLTKHQPLEIWLLSAFCTHFLKIAISEIFLRFLKIVVSTFNNHFMHFILPEKGRINPIKLNQPILWQNISRLQCTSDFKCGNLTINFTAKSMPFKNSKKRTVTSSLNEYLLKISVSCGKL